MKVGVSPAPRESEQQLVSAEALPPRNKEAEKQI